MIRIAHSPDSDDAFMFYALRESKITSSYDFDFYSAEIEKLNQIAMRSDFEFDVIAVSFHAYKYLRDKFTLLRSGSSYGSKNHGPKLVSKFAKIPKSKTLKVAVPGRFTSAYLCLCKYFELEQVSHEAIFCNYDEVFDLLERNADASLLIHESQLKYKDLDLHLIADLGTWYYEFSGGDNLPLGCNVAASRLGENIIQEIDELINQSILWAWNNYDEAMRFASKFAKHEMDENRSRAYLELYVPKAKLSDLDLTKLDKFLV